MPTMMVQSAAMRRLRRELEASRRRAALAPTGGVAKKPSSPPPRRCSAPTPPAPRRAAGDTTLVAHAPPSSAACCTRHAAAPTAEPAGLKSSCFGKGAQVRVRTPVGTLRTGQRLVFWLGAVVVSGMDEDGYLRVIYNNGKFPRDNPSGTARVARKDVKDDVPRAAVAIGTDASAGSSAVTTDRSASTSKDKAALRPTVAGKKLPLLKKLEEEMRSTSNAILASW